MLSSFIALAAGMIGGVDVSAAASPAPAEIVEAAPAAMTEQEIASLVAEVRVPAPGTEAEPGLVEVQATEPDPDRADVPVGEEESLPTPVAPPVIERPQDARETVGQTSDAPDPSIVSPNQRRAGSSRSTRTMR